MADSSLLVLAVTVLLLFSWLIVRRKPCMAARIEATMLIDYFTENDSGPAERPVGILARSLRHEACPCANPSSYQIQLWHLLQLHESRAI